MESLPKNKILQFNPDTLESVRTLYQLDKPGQMKEAVDILEDWVQKQNHFMKKDFSRDYLEITILSTKGSVERAKTRLDKVCTMRTLMPNFYADDDVKHDFKHLYYDHVVHAALPKLTKDNYRVFLLRNCGTFQSSKDILDYYRLYIIFAEYLRVHDYAAGLIYVLDYRDLNIMSYATNCNIIELRKITTLLMEGYGIRIKGIHIISTSKLIDVLVSMFKQVVSEKIGGRFYVHKDLDSLHKVVPKEILPSDFGGEERSFNDLHEEWTEVLASKEHTEYRREMTKAQTDESLRQVDKFNEQYMGMPGTFRTLSVD